jgi:Putative methyltransferase
MSPLRTALLAQLFGALIAVAVAQLLYPKVFSLPIVWALGQGVCAALASYKLEAPRWWLAIHLVFLPLVIAANHLGIPPLAWLGGFLLLFMLFWRTDKSRVPLFLTNARAAQAVAELIPAHPCRCIDLGCGTGSLLKTLAAVRPECTFVGVEHAPLPFVFAWFRSRNIDNLVIRYGDFWKVDLGQYQVVYAFLSPVPMQRLWQKSCAEMTANNLVISNSFEIPGKRAEQVVAVPDRRRTRLYCYLT